MSRRETTALKAALSILHYSGAGRMLAPLMRGDGVIFMLHHVTPEVPRAFDPNGILKITPEFLETVIQEVEVAGYDFIAMDDVPDRLQNSFGRRPFAAFTLDDGYKDNREHAYPIFKRHGVPFTIYVPSDFGDGKGELWWLALEEAIRRLPAISVPLGGSPRHFEMASDVQKSIAFHDIYWWLRRLPETEARAHVAAFAALAGFDAASLCNNLVMSWRELRSFAADPIVSVGAHTNSHYALAKLPADAAKREIVESITRVQRETGKPCRHFSYPYGCEMSAGEREFEMVRSLGLKTAVTTRKGLLHRSGAVDFAALPRLSLNGDYQDRRHLAVLLSGVPFALWNGLARLKTKAGGAQPSA